MTAEAGRVGGGGAAARAHRAESKAVGRPRAPPCACGRSGGEAPPAAGLPPLLARWWHGGDDVA